MRLTKKAIDGFKYEGDGSGQDIRWDAQIPGFGVRIYPTGKKSFVLSYRSDGRKHIMTVGRYGVMTLEQARDDAREKLVQVNKGTDPLEEKRRESQGETVKILCAQYLERYAKLKKKTWKEDERRIDRHLIPAWGLKKAKSIKQSDVSSLHFKIGKEAPYEANRVLALVSKIFEVGKKWGFVPDNFKNPARNIDKYNETSRDIHDLRRVSLWKLNRILEVSDDIIEGLRKLASLRTIEINSEPIKKIINELVSSDGIGFPMASSILKFIRPDIFPIIDVRAYRALTGKKLYSSQYNIELYVNYVEQLREYADKLNMPLSDMDEQLYEFDKEHNGKI